MASKDKFLLCLAVMSLLGKREIFENFQFFDDKTLEHEM